jgi:hypothetical protein
MKNHLIIAAGLLFLAAASLSATPTTCPTATLLTYLSTFGPGSGMSCMDGGLLLSNFSFNPFGTTLLAASAVTITPFVNVGGETGLNFSVAGMSVTNSAFEDIDLEYTITAPLTDLMLSFNSIVGGAGNANVMEFACINQSILTCPSGDFLNPAISVTNPPASNFTNKVFLPPGVTSLDVAKDVRVNGGCSPTDTACSGMATITTFENGFSVAAEPPVPEADTAFLLGLGLLGLGALKMRKA